MDDGIERIVIMLAGYNPKKYSYFDKFVDRMNRFLGGRVFERILERAIGYEKGKIFLDNMIVKLAYAEELIDTANKAAMVLDKDDGRKVIDYPLKAVLDIPGTHAIVVGNRGSLEDILQRYEDVTLLDQGNSFIENLEIGNSCWNRLRESYIDEGRAVSPYKYIIFADTFGATRNMIESSFKAIEESGADVCAGICLKGDDNPDRKLFNYRPWMELRDAHVRNSNIGALRHGDKGYRQLSVSHKAVETLSGAYGVRKLLNPLNWFRIASFAVPFAARYWTSKALGLASLNYSLSGVESKVAKALSTKEEKVLFSFIAVPAALEMDIDSVKDIKRAKKMVAMSRMNYSLDDCISLYERCQEIGLEKVEVVDEKIRRVRMSDILPIIFRYRDLWPSTDYGIDLCTSFYIDLKNAYEEHFQKNRIRVAANIENAFNITSRYRWNPLKNRLESYPIDVMKANELLDSGIFCSRLLELAENEEINPRLKAEINRSIRNICRVERKEPTSYNADLLIRKYRERRI